MTTVLRDSAFVPAGSAVRSLTLAELLALPAVTDLVTAGKALGIGRSASYELARAGRFPCQVIRAGRNYRVPTVGLLALLGMPALSPHLPQAPASAGDRPGYEAEEDPAEPTPATGQAPHGDGVHPERPEAAPDLGREGLMAVDWLDQWLSQAVLRESSRRSYRGHLRNHLRPRLSGVLLAEVDVVVLQRLFAGMLDDGVPEATTRRVYYTVRSALNAAASPSLLPAARTAAPMPGAREFLRACAQTRDEVGVEGHADLFSNGMVGTTPPLPGGTAWMARRGTAPPVPVVVARAPPERFAHAHPRE
jgi:hypothetical protein